jgi:hypothetical protein
VPALLYDGHRACWLVPARPNATRKTAVLYGRCAEQSGAYLAAVHPAVMPTQLTREHVEGFIEAFARGTQVGELGGYEDGRAPATVSLTYGRYSGASRGWSTRAR